MTFPRLSPLSCLFSFFALVPAAQAQTSGPGNLLPTAPYVAPVPIKGQWIITVRDAADNTNAKPASPGQLVQIDSTKTGQIKRDVLTHGDGSRQEIWYADDFQFTPYPNGTDVSITSVKALLASLGGAGSATVSVGFPGVEWVNASHFDKEETKNGVVCFHYVMPPGQGIPGDAWIDAQTRLPVAYQMGGLTYIYHFDESPAGTLTLPEPDQAAEKRAEDMLERHRRLGR